MVRGNSSLHLGVRLRLCVRVGLGVLGVGLRTGGQAGLYAASVADLNLPETDGSIIGGRR